MGITFSGAKKKQAPEKHAKITFIETRNHANGKTPYLDIYKYNIAKND